MKVLNKNFNRLKVGELYELRLPKNSLGKRRLAGIIKAPVLAGNGRRSRNYKTPNYKPRNKTIKVNEWFEDYFSY